MPTNEDAPAAGSFYKSFHDQNLRASFATRFAALKAHHAAGLREIVPSVNAASRAGQVWICRVGRGSSTFPTVIH